MADPRYGTMSRHAHLFEAVPLSLQVERLQAVGLQGTGSGMSSAGQLLCSGLLKLGFSQPLSVGFSQTSFPPFLHAYTPCTKKQTSKC
jgi:hypothetical protein